ncbi:MAG: class I tRNA ligase family protein [bacterium]|nr:class I tRNA ligase family protein [bacterium]
MAEEHKFNKHKLALNEEKILEFWKKQDIFKKTLEKESPKGEFIFYEGPPTANARPAIHHMEARAFKDAIPRYKTMQGFHVRRKGGWDTHGLPVEIEVEKSHNFKSKKDIETYGVAKFNDECRENVWKYIDEWEKFTERMGYWVDQENPYKTYQNSYVESVWWIIKQINDKKLLYKDYRIVPWCPRCGTALSSHELAQGYADVKDLTVTIELRVKEKPNTSFLAWTTTPWTLPGNVALAVGENISYAEVEFEKKKYILAEDLVSKIFADKKDWRVVSKTLGKNLVGLSYEPLYNFLSNALSSDEKKKLEKAFEVYSADFVTTTDGTGIVHIAPMYGVDDFNLGTKVGLPKHHLVNDSGNFLEYTGFLAGRFVKDEGTTVEIIKDLAHRGLLFQKEKYTHTYPHCWRCKTPLIYFARNSWYIRMSKLRDKLIKENKKINWEPEHIRDGRFGEWLSDVKDWAISRERYWGTPLPVWQTADGSETLVVDSIETLRERAVNSGNRYFIMRHGGTECNKNEIVSFKHESADHLTEEGKKQVEKSAKSLRGKKIDIIFSSPFVRTMETARRVAKTLGIAESEIIADGRIKEINPGNFDGGDWNLYHRAMYASGPDWFESTMPSGESLKDVQKRVGSFLYEIEEKYKNKNILIITHGGPAWIFHVVAGLYMPENRKYEMPSTHIFVNDFRRFNNAEIRELPFSPLPHDHNFSIDLHKPYIDSIVLLSNSGEKMNRVREVMDVWFDSGAMPFAQDHYPFENKKYVDKIGFPADFISEAIDQTRGWFYTLHAIGVLLGKGRVYKNVICLGHILDKEGKKMSKSVGNVVNPWEMIDKYGVDALRFWMYSVNQPGDSKNFDEKTVDEIVKRLFNILTNVYSFYELYADKNQNEKIESEAKASQSKNILDRWILSRLAELTKLATEKLDAYKLLEPTRAIREFVDDLSTWYLRRSRDRFKSDDIEDKNSALRTMRHVLLSISKLLAPFTPFYAEDLFGKTRSKADLESVHLSDWPKAGLVDTELLKNMQETRRLVTIGLEQRSRVNIKVRQPLSSAKIKSQKVKLDAEFLELIKDELNVKQVSYAPINNDIEIDANITEELRREGVARDLIRSIQELRKTEGLTVGDRVALLLDSDEKAKELVHAYLQDIKKVTLVTGVEYTHLPHIAELVVEEFKFKIAFKR